MDEMNQIIHTISLSMGAAWASGINLYATLLTLGLLGATGNMTLPPDLQILTNPLVIGAAGLMFVVEFVADKMPGVDTGWDSIHTFIRIPAGAMLAAASLGEVNSAMTVAAAILGGTLAAGSHATKAGSRVLINTSPEPFSNWLVSLAEDVAVIAGVWAALAHPYVFLVVLLILIILMIWLLPKLWTGIKEVFTVLGRIFTGNKGTPPSIDN
ncbi:MAG: DUF4126 domain-containing protein [Desulfobacterales bacterium]|nr:MAG: DUF4126 domain-containing protein [Desulfobacterales bacterium]